jgi:hypothetical protein
MSAKQMYDCFWEAVEGEALRHKCKCCNLVRNCNTKKSGYGNLKDHLVSKHPDWQLILGHFANPGLAGPIDAFVVQISPKAHHIFNWLDWIVDGNKPFSFCEEKGTRKYTNLAKMSSKTLRKYIKFTGDKVRDKMSITLPKSFGLVIDGWTIGSDHYSCLFAAWTNKMNGKVDVMYLSCNVAEDITAETVFDEALPEAEKKFGFSADDWFDIIVDCLRQYEFEVDVDSIGDTVEFLSADNCSTNGALARRAGLILLDYTDCTSADMIHCTVGIPLIGCYSHKLNLAVAGIVGREEKRNRAGLIIQEADGSRPVVNKLDQLMGSLKTLKNAARLRPLTKLRPERKNATRWYSLFHMLVKWKRIRQFVNAIEDFEVSTSNLIPTHAENATLAVLLDVLRDFESVSQVLQRAGDETLTLYQSRLLFDKLLDKYSTRYELSQLKANSELVTHPDFEKGIIKIQKGLDERNKLTSREKNAVSRYLKIIAGASNNSLEVEDEIVENLGFADACIADAEREQKRRRIDTVADAYLPTAHVLSQSNLCERLFSLAKLIMTDRRQSMHPSTLNDLLLLKLNHKLWAVSDIHYMLQTIGDGEPAAEFSDDEDDVAEELDADDGDDVDEVV